MPLSNYALLGALLSASLANAFTPLADKRFAYNQIPYKVDTDVGLPRGTQLGYNQCNSTTEGPNSLCQTAVINSLDDFCLWAPSEPGHTVGDIEGEMIAWCSKPGHGTRVMPKGTITGVQFTRTPDYIQVVGFMDQTKINMVAGDDGGEMDPHGADRRGNPIGGLVYTNAWTGGYSQAVEWHNFNGANMFCFKACDPKGPKAARYCEHIYDIMGCGFNAPSNAKEGVFESCASDSQDPPGQYVNAAGQTTTWRQGDGNPPYTPRIPSSSLCSTFASTDIFDKATNIPIPTPSAGSQSSSSSISSGSSSLPTSVSTSHTSSVSSGSSSASHSSSSGTSSRPASSSTTASTTPSRTQDSSNSPSETSNNSGAGKSATSLSMIAFTALTLLYVVA
ncbi:hypothetical protein D9613_012357 [Agrocybe pediades]|uniref:Macrofage activating glycoprotein n=1 Tax=Agrocybe pediades TaxID=84607 RepID=A0A8H4QRF5_9AGAR|nr:hypothetical protein D9613_012357 [Agrocybe pediades]KAF9563652.1 hypothetical protein CPC08DRAFT_760644 [Agrocybe pediades]